MDLAIIGGGPGGLRAAEVAASAGARVTLYEGKASAGRKFLVAGKGGLNLTHSESLEKFSGRYSGSATQEFWTSLLSEFDSAALRAWTAGLGIETFVGTSGRVFPKEFKAAPLLRRWVARLRELDVQFSMHHRLEDISREDDRFILEFIVKQRALTYSHDAVILALGGASWPETGSDGKWTSLLKSLEIFIAPLEPSNCGWEVNWHPDILAEAEGFPLKNIAVTAGENRIPGELLITRYGLEGGALYQLGSILRCLPKPSLTLDLKPSLSVDNLVNKLSSYPACDTRDLVSAATAAWRLGKASCTLLRHLTPRPSAKSPHSLAKHAKELPIPLLRPRPIAEAISSAGGVSFRELDEYLMVRECPGLFVAGEMIDWEAPTGGYLLQGCFATGTRAARGALDYLGHAGRVPPTGFQI